MGNDARYDNRHGGGDEIEVFMKTYIFLCSIASYISGAPIYYRNKATYLEAQGWNVVILPVGRGEVYITGLERFARGSFPLMGRYPSVFTPKQRNRTLCNMVEAVGPVGECCIVETGTDYTALWGELLAQRLGARHMLMLLDEANPYLKLMQSFLEFKLDRGEFYAITKDVVVNTFKGSREITNPEDFAFKAWCTNSVQDIESDLMTDFETCNFVIGSIGRLEKDFVPGLVDSIAEFAREHSELLVGVAFFGGTTDSAALRKVDSLREVPNIRLLVTGYMWPFPREALDKVDVFASAAGGVIISDALGIPTIAMDVKGGGVIGYSRSPEREAHPLFRSGDNDNPSDATWYFEDVLEGNVQRWQPSLDIDAQWQKFCRSFAMQIDDALSLTSPPEYYDTARIASSRKSDKVLRALCPIGGLMLYEAYRVGRGRQSVRKKDVLPWM